ncbi:MAG: 16S rRNA (uracil(1498)-N(3))-methyltransferase [Chloroflexi bacterium]|nr:16S rRNA (uracil(1498)-N(3))-methyltransferase [Chloroflexota bacterium]
MHRFFLPPSSIRGPDVIFTGPVVHQLTHVLRLTPGDAVKVLDNSGWEYEVELGACQKDQVQGTVRRKSLVSTEARTKVSIYQALLKGAKYELVLQKGTELGVVGFVPMVCERCVPGDTEAVGDSKLKRWEKIILEAAEQSRRGKLPRLMRPVGFREACRSAEGLSLLPWEGEKVMGLKAALRKAQVGQKLGPQRPFSVNLFIGPEGGFSPGEIDLALSAGVIPVSLGPRICRAETAGLAAAAAVLYEMGDLGG